MTDAKNPELKTITLEDMTEAQELAVQIVMDTGKYNERDRIREFVLHYSSRIEMEPGNYVRDEITLSVSQFLQLLHSDKSRLEELSDGKE
jgi:hypothetical protein